MILPAVQSIKLSAQPWTMKNPISIQIRHMQASAAAFS